MVIAEFGESANELIQKWHGGYRYGFPDFVAAEFPVRPMHYDQSRIYSGVVGRHYPDAETMRYHYMFDQNMYLQPGISDAPAPTSGLSPGARFAIALGVLGAATAGAVVMMRHARHYRR
jgi:hypothetical protein